jgi:FkbM family methyltransferase
MMKIFKNTKIYLKEFVRAYKNIRRLKAINFEAQFKLEGGLIINLPYIGYSDLLSKQKRKLAQLSVDYSRRTNAECLLRTLVYQLFQTGYLKNNKCIIDIGSWLGDNSITWAKMLSKKANLYAIDPSQSNLEFSEAIAKLNKVNNIRWVKAICSDKSGALLSIEGDINHAIFHEASKGTISEFKSTTLDQVVPESDHKNISMIHVDVEGFEEKVILGAVNIIKKSKPMVIFEQHISSEDPSKIFTFLRSYNYCIFMINEVLPGCRYDCRNFIAFSLDINLPTIPTMKQNEGAFHDIWFAILGPSLIKVR